MGCPATGPCEPFITELDLCCLITGAFPDPCIVDGQPIDQTKVDAALQAASELMWAATGRKFGTCTVKLRPCKQGGGCNPCEGGGEIPFFGAGEFGYGFGSAFPWYPQLLNGVWTNISCNSCAGQCGCSKLCEIELPYPVCCITEVKLGGQVVPTEDYRVDDFRKLVKLDSSGPHTIPDEITDITLVDGIYAPNGGLAPKATFNDRQTSFEFTLNGDTGAVVPTFEFFINANRYSDSLLFGIFGADAQAMGFAPNQAVTAGATGSTVIAGITVTFTMVSGGILHMSPPTGAFAGRDVADLNTDPIVVRFEFSEFIKNIVIGNNNTGQDLTGIPAGFTDFVFGFDSGVCWPTCQNLALEDTNPDTFSVTVTYGREVPFLVKQGTAELACQFLKACVGAPCQLPQRISSMSRQGVTVGFLDTMSFLEKGRTGIYLVDLAINTFNPYRLLKQASVYSIDSQPKWRRTDTGRDC